MKLTGMVILLGTGSFHFRHFRESIHPVYQGKMKQHWFAEYIENMLAQQRKFFCTFGPQAAMTPESCMYFGPDNVRNFCVLLADQQKQPQRVKFVYFWPTSGDNSRKISVLFSLGSSLTLKAYLYFLAR